MSESSDEFTNLVQQKMQARAERHVREQQADTDEQMRELATAQSAQAMVVQAQQQLIAERRQREADAEARRNRPNLVAQYKLAPAGVRLVATLRDVCLKCGSENIRVHTHSRPHVRMCSNCNTDWFASRCWSCTTGQLDSRDPESAPCEKCGHLKCTVCGACNPHGCSTNPYKIGQLQRQAAAS